MITTCIIHLLSAQDFPISIDVKKVQRVEYTVVTSRGLFDGALIPVTKVHMKGGEIKVLLESPAELREIIKTQCRKEN